ncbi:hypothetical protein [Pandoraea sputorum]|nr:hypothetical protein [Pandoraea sputorum]
MCGIVAPTTCRHLSQRGYAEAGGNGTTLSVGSAGSGSARSEPGVIV